PDRAPAPVHAHRGAPPPARTRPEAGRHRRGDPAQRYQVLQRARDDCSRRRTGQPLRDHPRVSAVVAPAHGAGAPAGSTRNVLVMSAAVFLLIAGEQLWSRFLPVYLVTLGAPAVALGLWGSSKDFLDAALQYPGGALSDRYGSQRALMAFTAIAGLGYLAYRFAPSWPWLFAGLVLVSAWGSLGSPAMFALVAESLPSGRRARGFM